MKIITVSREFGSGGRELGKRLSDIMDFDYYDSEIISAVAEKSGLDARYVEKALNDHGWRGYNVTYSRTIGSPLYLQSDTVKMLLEQKKVIENIAALGKDFVIIGRNSDIILEKFSPLNIFVCSDEAAKLKRCAERAPKGENFTEKELLHKMKQIDKARSKTREIISGSPWGKNSSYHLTVNTAGWNIKELAKSLADFASGYFGRTK